MVFTRPRPKADIAGLLSALIPRMGVQNLLRGAPRIQDELLKFGFVVAQLSLSFSSCVIMFCITQTPRKSSLAG